MERGPAPAGEVGDTYSDRLLVQSPYVLQAAGRLLRGQLAAPFLAAAAANSI